MTRTLLALFVGVLMLVAPGLARADQDPPDVRYSPSGTLRFIPAANALPAAEMLARTADEDRAWVAQEVGRDYDGVTDVFVALDDVSFIAMQPPNALAPVWAGGVAYPRLNRVVLKLGPKENNPRALLRHELSHIAIGRLTQHRAPRWLLEGLAILHSGDTWNREGPSLMRATLSDNLFTFESLADGFPASPSDAELAYAQSTDFVKYLVDRFGEDKVQHIIRSMIDGAGFDESVIKVLESTPRQLENQWRRSLNRWEMVFRLVSSYEFLLGFATLLCMFAWWKLRQRRRLHLQRLEQEEQIAAMRELLRTPAVWADMPMSADAEEGSSEDAEHAEEFESAESLDEAHEHDLDEDDVPEEFLARREPPPPKKPTLH